MSFHSEAFQCMSRHWNSCEGIAMHWNAMHATDFLTLESSIHFLWVRSISMHVKAFQFMWRHCNALECNACYKFRCIRIFNLFLLFSKLFNACQGFGMRAKALQYSGIVGMQYMLSISSHWNIQCIAFDSKALQCISRHWNACEGIAMNKFQGTPNALGAPRH